MLTTLKRALEALARRLGPPPVLRLDFDARGLSLLAGNQPTWHFAWAQVRTIRAYKADLMTVDRICAEFEVADPPGGDQARFYTVHEDMAEFDTLCFRLRGHFPGLPEDWWQRLARPPFAANRTQLWPPQLPFASTLPADPDTI